MTKHVESTNQFRAVCSNAGEQKAGWLVKTIQAQMWRNICSSDVHGMDVDSVTSIKNGNLSKTSGLLKQQKRC